MIVQFRALRRDASAANLTQFISASSYIQPDMMSPSAWTEHAPFAFWLIDALRPRTIAELGVHAGFSYFAFCQAVRAFDLPARCFGIDHWGGDEHAGFYGDDVYNAVCRYNRRYDAFSQPIRSSFADARGGFADGSIDLLHIDGFHSYEAVRGDFESWLPKMSDRGVVLFHDIAEFGEGFGVYRLWEELRARFPYFEFAHGHGLGVLGVGAHLPARLGALFETSQDCTAADSIRMTYRRLGASLRVDELNARVRELETALTAHQTSTSWRLTAPLRAVSRLMSRASGAAGGVSVKLRDAAVLSEDVVPPRYSDLSRAPLR